MLADLLSSDGVDAAPVSGMVRARLAGAPDDWPMQALDHTALRVDDLIVDLTRQQFDGEEPRAWLLEDPAIAVFENRPHAYLRNVAGTTGMDHAFVTALRRPNAFGQINSLGLITRQLGTDFTADLRDALRTEIADVRLEIAESGPSTPSPW